MAGIEIITRTERRRRWSRADRARILAECAAPNAIIIEVCRRNDVASSLVHKWRRQEREREVSGYLPPFIGYGELASLPAHGHGAVEDAPIAHPAGADVHAEAVVAAPGTIEILFPGGIQLAVRGAVSDRALAQIFHCLQRRPC